MSARIRGYAFSLTIAAVALVALLSVAFPIASWLPVLVLMVLAFVTENLAFQLPVGTSVSLSFALIYAALLHSGPFAAVLCALSVSVTAAEFRMKKPVLLMAFNASQASLAAGLAGFAYVLAGGAVMAGAPHTVHVNLPAAALAALVFYGVNVSLVSAFVALRTQQPAVTVLRNQGFLSYAASLVVLALLGIMIAELLAVGSWAGLLLLVLPFMAARRTFRVYAELSEAFTSTVRSLITALEAKDPYTRGHSERVAVISRRLGDALHFSRSELDLLERAALLHDVGKIGIPVDTLTSPTRLSSDEVRMIRQHPVLGSQLVSDVEFLSDVVPIIRHHHERIDGSGYPDGLVGASIPHLSRVLAVADAYDAMTSDRAYRVGMSHQMAIAEIRRVAGTQLDQAIVDLFVDVFLVRPDEGAWSL